ncbi:MAG TPA: hypothetical protein VLH38_01450 [Patescibacteria group bacterium]|nr:hypothetical protein [Patescibacteria group bacterium]
MAEQVSDARLLHTYGQPVREEFQNDLTAPMDAWANRVDVAIGHHPEELRAAGNLCVTDAIDYSVAAYFPDLFDDCGSDGLPVPLTSEAAVDAHMDSYWPEHVARYCARTGITPKPADTPYSNYGSWPELQQRVITGSMRKKLTHTLKVRGTDMISPEEWRAYQAVDEAAQRRSGPDNLWVNAADMCVKDRRIFPSALKDGTLALFEDMPGRSKSFVVAANVALDSLGIANIRVPVGDYDLAFAKRIAATAWLAAHFIKYDVAHNADARATTAANAEFYGSKTMRAYNIAGGDAPIRPVEQGVIGSEQEGNITTASSLAFLTNSYIPGKATGPEAITWLAEHNMVTALARIAALNFMAGVATLAGARYPGAVENIDGRPLLAQGFVDLNTRAHELHTPYFAEVKRKIHEQGVDPATLPAAIVARTGKRGCTLAFAPRVTEGEDQLDPVTTRYTQTWTRLFDVLGGASDLPFVADEVPVLIAGYTAESHALLAAASRADTKRKR